MSPATPRSGTVVAALALSLGLLASACGQSVFELAIGDCINLPDGVSVTDVENVECTEPHDAEVYALPQLSQGPDEPFPGDSVISEFVEERCTAAFEGYVGRDFATSAIFSTALTPSQEGWENADDREVVCLLVGEGGAQLTGSKRNSGE